jgi:FkbM family methyltransferase
MVKFAVLRAAFCTLATARAGFSSDADSCAASSARCLQEEERVASQARSALQVASAKTTAPTEELPWQVTLLARGGETVKVQKVASQSLGAGNPQFSKMPKHVYEAGLRAYGTDGALERAIRASQIFKVSFAGFELTVHCAPKDDISDRSADLEDSWNSYGADRLASLAEGTTVLDIGANLGILSSAYYKANPKLKIIAVEAMPETFFYMNWNLHENSVPVLEGELLSGPGVLPLNKAMGNGRDNVTMVYPRDPGGTGVVEGHEHSSLHAYGSYRDPKGEWIAPDSLQFSMPTTTLGSLYMRHGLNDGSPAFIFFDCQGCEFDGVLPSLGYLTGTQQMGGELHCFDQHTTPACKQLQSLICSRGQQEYFRWFDMAADGHEELHRGIDCGAIGNTGAAR